MHKPFLINIQVVLRRGDSLLLLQRQGKWTIPGGRMEDSDQSLEDALRRELKEETGITNIRIDSVFHAFSTPNTVLLYYRAETDESEVVLSFEHQNYKWVNITDLDSYAWEYDGLGQIIQLGLSGCSKR